MTSPTERQITVIQQGRTASALLREARPILEEQHSDALSRLKAIFRDGNYNEAKLASGIAELCAIDDLIQRLDARVESANTVQKEINNA